MLLDENQMKNQNWFVEHSTKIKQNKLNHSLSNVNVFDMQILMDAFGVFAGSAIYFQYQQFVLQHCHLRNRIHFDWTLIVDLDEFVLPIFTVNLIYNTKF